MTADELNRELDWLRREGFNPQLCDTPVPLVDVPVLAGQPAEAGDATPGEYVMVPRALVGRHPVFLIDVDGYSMRDAGIMPGDRLEVTMDARFDDGDIVVAEVDGSCTVKTIFTDGEGVRWLVPRNEAFDAICLTGRQWRVVGKVTGLRKGIARTTFADCVKSVDRQRAVAASQGQAADVPPMPPLLVLKKFHNRRRIDYNAVRAKVETVVVMQMKHRYEWYAAYRVLMDLGLMEELRLSRFAQQMEAWFPDAPIRCTSDSLSDYAVGSTARAFTLWSVEAFHADRRRDQSLGGFTTLYHRCEELRAALFPLPVLEVKLPF